MKRFHIGIILYERCTSSMVTGFWDIFGLANQMYKNEKGYAPFSLELIGVSKEPVRSFSGLSMAPKKTLRSRLAADLIYVPGFIGDVDTVIAEEQRLIKWLSHVDRSKTIVTAACNGNVLLAESGVLDHKRGTTHWSLTELFRQRYPQIVFEPEKILVDNNDTISAAGVTAFYNLGLHIIQRFLNPDIALNCAKVFLVDAGRKLQLPYQVYQVPTTHGDAQVAGLQTWIETNLQNEFTMNELAERASLGSKTLLRRFKRATGETPLVYQQKLRIETAKRLLETNDKTFNEITWEVGYRDVSSFHKKFKMETGLTPSEYRSKFLL